jgi:DNA-binding transcriptional LysR family regulator
LELRHLKYFITLATYQHYGKAADKLFITQPTLSHQIKQLESELGFSLFDVQKRKVSRKVVLSPIGEEFLVKIQPIVAKLEGVVDEIKQSNLKKSNLRIGVYKILLKERVTEMIDVLRSQYPNISAKLIEYSTSHEVENHLADGSIDLGLTILPHRRKDLLYKVIKHGYLAILVNSSNRLAGFSQVKISDVTDENWIELHRDIHPFLDQIEEYIIPNGLNRSGRIVQEVSSLELMSSLIKINLGIGFVSSLFDIKKDKALKKILMVRDDGSKIEIINALSYKNEALGVLVDRLSQKQY